MKFLGHIFDLDGTLAHTMPLHYEAWQLALEPHQIEFPLDRFYALGGVPTVKIVELLAEEQGKILDPIAITEFKEDYFFTQLHRVGPVPPVKDIAAAQRGLTPLAVATGSNRHTAEKVLDHLNMRNWFDAVITADDITHPKPAPDTFLIAAEKIGVAPKDCCAYEDTELGLQSIHAAGMHAVDVRPMYPEHAY